MSLEISSVSSDLKPPLHTKIVPCVQRERDFLLFLFLLTLGPPLPIALYGFSMLEIHGDAFILGGEIGYANYNSAIYQITCSSGICSWSTLNQELKVARYNTVAIRVPDNFCLEDTTGIVI